MNITTLRTENKNEYSASIIYLSINFLPTTNPKVLVLPPILNPELPSNAEAGDTIPAFAVIKTSFAMNLSNE